MEHTARVHMHMPAALQLGDAVAKAAAVGKTAPSAAAAPGPARQ